MRPSLAGEEGSGTLLARAGDATLSTRLTFIAGTQIDVLTAGTTRPRLPHYLPQVC